MQMQMESARVQQQVVAGMLSEEQAHLHMSNMRQLYTQQMQMFQQQLANLQQRQQQAAEQAQPLSAGIGTEPEDEGEGPPPPPDAVLVFLSGTKEIETMVETLLRRPQFSSPQCAQWVLALHGGLPPEEQRRVFERPPRGIRKVVCCTNVAETSITVDDVGFVIDTARMKEQRYDASKRLASLEDCFVSRANARQRRGRAGRVAPGVAVHLFSKHTHDKLIDAHQAPEVQRVPLEQLVLRIRAMNLPGTAASVCQRLLEPPSTDAVNKAVMELVSLDALKIDTEAKTEELTDLGKHLANLPVDARLGKLILLGSAFGPEATDMALTAAAALACRSPFLSPPDAREEAEKCKAAFADRGEAGPSDHIAILNAYWHFNQRAGMDKIEFARENFLGIKTLREMGDLKRQLLQMLSEAHFVPPGLHARRVEYLARRADNDGVWQALMPEDFEDVGEEIPAPSLGQQLSPLQMLDEGEAVGDDKNSLGGGGGGGGGMESVEDALEGAAATAGCENESEEQEEDREAHNAMVRARRAEQQARIDARKTPKELAPLLTGLLVAALFPQIIMVKTEEIVSKKKKKTTTQPPKFFIREHGSNEPVQVSLHPSSVNQKTKEFTEQYLVYHQLVRTNKLYVRDTTPVPPIALVLFGGSLSASQKLNANRPGEATLSVDGWISVSVSTRVQKLLVLVRQHLDGLLQDKVKDPTATFSAGSEQLLKAVVALLEEGEQEKDIALEPPGAYQVQNVPFGWGADPAKIAMANKLLGIRAGGNGSYNSYQGKGGRGGGKFGNRKGANFQQQYGGFHRKHYGQGSLQNGFASPGHGHNAFGHPQEYGSGCFSVPFGGLGGGAGFQPYGGMVGMPFGGVQGVMGMGNGGFCGGGGGGGELNPNANLTSKLNPNANFTPGALNVSAPAFGGFEKCKFAREPICEFACLVLVVYVLLCLSMYLSPPPPHAPPFFLCRMHSMRFKPLYIRIDFGGGGGASDWSAGGGGL